MKMPWAKVTLLLLNHHPKIMPEFYIMGFFSQNPLLIWEIVSSSSTPSIIKHHQCQDRLKISSLALENSISQCTNFYLLMKKLWIHSGSIHTCPSSFIQHNYLPCLRKCKWDLRLLDTLQSGICNAIVQPLYLFLHEGFLHIMVFYVCIFF